MSEEKRRGERGREEREENEFGVRRVKKKERSDMPVNVPIMRTLVPNPFVNRATMPVSLAIVAALLPLLDCLPNKETMESAGWETIAQMTPAKYPDIKVMPN